MDERNPAIRKRIAEEEGRKAATAQQEQQQALAAAPRALQRFYKK